MEINESLDSLTTEQISELYEQIIEGGEAIQIAAGCCGAGIPASGCDASGCMCYYIVGSPSYGTYSWYCSK